MSWLTSDLLTQIRLRAQLPDAASDGAFTDADLLLLADDEISTRILPAIRDAREDYWVTHKDFACDGTTTDFLIPTRSQSGSLRDVLIVGSSGAEQSIPQMPVSEMWRVGTDGGPLRFAVIGDHVRLLGDTPSSDYTLRLRYYRRPSKLVQTTACDQVTALTADTLYASGTVFSSADVVDIVGNDPPFQAHGDSYVVTVITTLHTFVDEDGDAVAFDGSNAAAGDWICPEGQTCVVPVPTEFFPLLARLTATAVLESKGDRQGASSSWIVAERLLQELRSVIQPRVDGEAKRIINRNSPLRARRRR